MFDYLIHLHQFSIVSLTLEEENDKIHSFIIFKRFLIGNFQDWWPFLILITILTCGVEYLLGKSLTDKRQQPHICFVRVTHFERTYLEIRINVMIDAIHTK